MNIKKTIGLAMAGVITLSLTGLQPAQAQEDIFGFIGTAGGTKITAVGSTISSAMTAQSQKFSFVPDKDTNYVASVNASPLATTGAVNTDVTGVAAGDGFTVTAHSRTANVALLNGLIKAQAVDTTSITTANSTSVPSAKTNTQFVGLTINGKAYPVNVAPNTSVTIAGVATIRLNWTVSATENHAIATQGGGLLVTLLKARNGIAAGAVVILNPTFGLVAQVASKEGGKPLGGLAYGVSATSNAGDAATASTGYIGVQNIPAMGTDGLTFTNTTGKVTVNGLLTVDAVESTATGVTTPALTEATLTNKITGLRLFPTLLGSLISATAIGSTAHVRYANGVATQDGTFQFVNLRINGELIPVDVAPNTRIHVPNLGWVTVNERVVKEVDGVVHSYKVIGLHIVLDTARGGLPVGADIQVGVSNAVVGG